ncbi:HNH endonuclease [Myxacorys almedinensis]|uniref:HNH endonuclease n=1 Tax=Myxacorys almedinensis TaxID=2651157 RepID=UPI003B75BB4C
MIVCIGLIAKLILVEPLEKLTIEHLKPKSRGGSNLLENLRLACLPCHHSRGNSLYPPRLFGLSKKNA